MVQLLFALSPFLIIAFGALCLMLAEALSKHKGGLAFGCALVFFAGLCASIGVWLNGVDGFDKTVLAPWLVIDNFTIFFHGLMCLGGGLAALLAGGYLAEHDLDRGEFYALLLFSTFGAMMLAAAGDALIV